MDIGIVKFFVDSWKSFLGFFEERGSLRRAAEDYQRELTEARAESDSLRSDLAKARAQLAELEDVRAEIKILGGVEKLKLLAQHGTFDVIIKKLQGEMPGKG